tara:strand:- start:2 stop:700 length:699 start_codon:yes stop_codon:yes gene_type:complete
MIKFVVLFFLDLVRVYWHQPNILRSLKRLNIKNAFDVGAHRGETIDYLLKIRNIKKIYSFEPQVNIFKTLKQKYKKNKKVVLNNLAFSKNEINKTFYINELSSTSTFSKLNKDSTWLKIKNKILNKKNPIKKKITIKPKTIDNYIKKKKIKHLSLLKLDTEGHELAVLEGSLKSIRKSKIKYLLIEIHFSKMYKGYSNQKILKFLKKNNFLLIKQFRFPFLSFVDNLYQIRD